MDPAVEAMHLLGGGELFPIKEATSRELWRQIDRGLPTGSVELLMKRVPAAARRQWRAMIHPDASTPLLNRQSSEQTGRLAYILALSKEVWGTWTAAERFLMRPHDALDQKTPLEATTSEWGSREVESILRQIQFGLPA